MEHVNLGTINTKLEKEPGLEELRAQAGALIEQIAELNNKIEPITEALGKIPNARGFMSLVLKLDSAKDKTESLEINSKIDALFNQNPDVPESILEKIDKWNQLKKEVAALNKSLQEVYFKIKKIEILAQRDEFVKNIFKPFYKVIKENVDVNYSSLEAYEYKVKDLTEEAGMKLDDAYKTLSDTDQIRISKLEDAISEKEALLERLNEVEKALNNISGDDQKGSSLDWSKGEIMRVEKILVGKGLLEIL